MVELYCKVTIGYNPRPVFDRVPGLLAAALGPAGGGLSLEAALQGLSLGAARLY